MQQITQAVVILSSLIIRMPMRGEVRRSLRESPFAGSNTLRR